MVEEYKQQLAGITKFMLDELGLDRNNLPKTKFVTDEKNSKDLLGKTGYYDPNINEIIVYTAGRHIIDILKTFCHEFIHHFQNEEGRLNNIDTNDVNSNEKLMELEKEAYLTSNILYRKWTDSLRNNIYNK